MKTPKAQMTSQLLHEGWELREYRPIEHAFSDVSTWLPATVPGHVHLDLARAGVIPDPLQRMHERGVQWVDAASWVYRCEIAVDEEDLAGARHILHFDGLDTITTVSLNDVVIGETDNMFIPHEFDVTRTLIAGTNVLEVRFDSAQRVGDERRQRWLASDATLEAWRDRPGRHGLVARSMVRKAQYMYGWDWGPVLRSCGIWRPVTLYRVPLARIRDWSWAATFDGDDCTLTLVVWVDGDADDVRVRLTGNGIHLDAGAIVDGGRAELVLTVAQAQRWWPAGYGEPTLYDLNIAITAAGVSLHAIDTRLGLREIELVRESDAAGESFLFRVNGVPIFAKGANWIPDDSFPSRTTATRLHRQLSLARDCGMNMLRIWGGGVYESDEFYSACDELGLLVWQDFPYACALYPDDDVHADAAMVEARAAIRRLRNHTSLALYCGNNENQWLERLGYFGSKPRLLGRRLYDETLPAAVAAEDPSRPYWPSSPYGSRSNPSDDADGDCHYWNVWHGEGDWRHYTKCTARFVSEFGFSSPPEVRTLEEALDPSDLGVDTPSMRWHDKTGKGYDTYLGFIAMHYPMPTTLLDLVYYGQLNQADAMRFGIEHFRRLRPHTMGTLAWQLNDCWPVHSWSWIDYRLRPKAAWYAAKRFYAPLLLSLSRTGDRLQVHLVNDAVDGRSGTLLVRAVNVDGTSIWTVDVDAEIGSGGSVEVLDVELPARVLESASSAVVHATFSDIEATMLLVEPKDLTLALPRVRIAVDEGDDGIRLRLEAETLAVSVKLWLDGADANWTDNYFDLLPGVSRDVRVSPWSPMTSAELRARLRWRSL